MSQNLVTTKAFDFNPRNVSARLFFAKESTLDLRWHICDAAVWKEIEGQVRYMALHGKAIVAVVRCNTVEGADAERELGDVLCEDCLYEFANVADIVAARNMMDFRDPKSEKPLIIKPN